uniref:E3 ubiquitin-protein ligase n=1 Tax=Syphacia muris TaxID=451379 RepID=A0A158R6B5_9BILA
MRDTLLDAVRNKNWDKCEQLLYEDWTHKSCELFAPNVDAPWDTKLDDDKINSQILSSIASAFCMSETDGIDLDPLMSICGLSSNALKKGRICGRVFRNGEATYSCRECANDNTCVLCYDCFMKSAHRHHKYRVNASFGSGYCDCGDVEAWKSYPACELHSGGSQSDAEKEGNLPYEVYVRIRHLIRTILRYSTMMICWQHTCEIPSVIKYIFIREEMCAAPYQTMLFNDETHTYDALIRALNLSIHCDEQQAMLMATIVDHEGRTSVRSGSTDFCSIAKEEIQRRTQKDTSRKTEKTGPLEVRVMDSRLVAAQNLSLRLLSWLTSQINNFPPLGKVIGSVLLTEGLEDLKDVMEFEGDEEHETIVVHLMRCDKFLWKGARMSYHKMFMATVLMDSDQKHEFTRALVRNYRKIFLDFIDDDHEHSVSIAALTVQVFSVPTLSRKLIAEESALKVIMDVLVDFCQRYLKEPERKRFDFTSKKYPSVLRRAMFMICDFKYLLTFIPSEAEWTPLLQEKFFEGCVAFIRFLSYLQGMDEVKRESCEPQTWEPEWETAFNIHLRLQSAITMVIAWITSHKDVHARMFEYILNQICEYAASCPEFNDRIIVDRFFKVNGIRAMCIPFDVTRDKISVHQPLWRFFAGLFAAPNDFVENAIKLCSSHGINDHLEGKRAMLCEMPMRVLVLCAQCQAQMWRRNGFSLVNQIHNYFSPLCRSEMYDRDIQMMQVGAALSPADVFLVRFLHRFGLHHWATFGFEEQDVVIPSSNTSHEGLSKCTVTLAEEMLRYIISIIEERYLPHIGKSSRENALRREVLHILAGGPKPFSKIDHEIPECPLISEVSLNDVVKAICDFKKPTKTSAGMFFLKKSVWKEYSPFYYHYLKSHISQAEQYQHKERLGYILFRSLLACPPPVPPEFEPFFAPIRNLLLSPVLIRIVRVILERTAKRSRYSSDGLLHRALYIVGLGLNEQIVDDKFDFVNEAEKEDILRLMELLAGKAEASVNTDLLGYLIERYQRVKTKLNVDTPVEKEEKDIINESLRKSRRAAMAAKMRKQAMDQMNQMQKKFMNVNKSILEKESASTKNELLMDVVEDEEPIGITAIKFLKLFSVVPEDSGFPICLGLNCLSAVVTGCRRLTCILCQETEVVTYNGRPLVSVGFVQQSSLFAEKGEFTANVGDAFLPAHLPIGIDVSTCGHTMHFDCYCHYSETLKIHELGRPRQTLNLSQRYIDIESGEYLCPLCRRLSNSAIPLLPALSFLDIKRFGDYDSSCSTFDEWVKTFEIPAVKSAIASKVAKMYSRKSSLRSHSERFSLSKISQHDVIEDEPENSLSSASSANVFGEPSSEVLDGAAVRNMAADEAADTEESSLLGMLRFPNVVHKLKELVGHSKTQQDNISTSFLIWDTIKCFLETAYTVKEIDKVKTVFPRNVLEMITAWQMAAFTLKSIAVVLRREGKPLFGALNARQRECLYAVSRIAAIAAFNCSPSSVRQVFSTLVEPFFGSDRKLEQEQTPVDNRACGSSLDVPSGSQSASSSSTTTLDTSSLNILSIDMLSLAVEMAMSIGWSFVNSKSTAQSSEGADQYVVPNGFMQEHYAIRLALLGHIYQVN